jgi:amino acid transporter
LNKLKEILLGPPLPTQQFLERRLNKIRALATFSPDALSSIAYANQEIYLGLIVAGSVGLSMAMPIGIVIVVILAIVALSYYQTIQGYPTGGGSFIVARENLGTQAGVFAAAALLTDYLLNSAVSLTAAVEAIASAFPWLWQYRVLAALFLLLIITLVNLRGVEETGTFMAVPVYLFLVTYLSMLVYGAVRVLILKETTSLAQIAPPVSQPLTLFLLIRTFSAGCTALTGIEAISNGVPMFEPPVTKNAGKTLIYMTILMGLLFAGSIWLTQTMAVVAGHDETILSALARRLLGSGPLYLLIQISTMLILSVAANTSFAGFPRLAAILSWEKFMPRQLSNLGDRLVYANGIVALSVASALLIIFFGGDTHALIPLFAIGAFLAFTLSQAGMVMHWWKQRGPGWHLKMVINGIGALATGTTLLVIGFSKFSQGAWVVVIIIPAMAGIFYRIHTHYHNVTDQISLREHPPSIKPLHTPRVVIPVSGIHRGMFDAINLAQSICSDVTAVYVEMVPGEGERVKEKFQQLWPDVFFEIVPSPYRSIVGPILDFLDETDRRHHDGQQAVLVLPELIPARWWQSLLHNQTAMMLKAALLYRRRNSGFQRVIIDVPYHLKK